MEFFYLSFILLIVISALFSGCETGLYTVSRVKLRYRLDNNERRARALNWLLSPIGPSIICILIGNNIAAQLLATITEEYFRSYGAWSVVMTTVMLTPIVLIFAEFLPKYFFRRHSNQLTYSVAYILIFFRALLIIPIFLAHIITRVLQFVTRTGGETVWEPHTSKNNLRSFLKAETSGHDMTDVQKQLIDRVMALDRINVTYDKVSKPLATLETIEAQLSVAEAIDGIGPTYYTRYLVVDSVNQQAIGYISAATLVCANAHETIESLLQTLPKIRYDTAVHTALQQLNSSGSDMGIITDQHEKSIRILFRSDCVKVLANM